MSVDYTPQTFHKVGMHENLNSMIFRNSFKIGENGSGLKNSLSLIYTDNNPGAASSSESISSLVAAVILGSG